MHWLHFGGFFLVIVTNAMSYDVLMGRVMLYPMGFTLDLKINTTSYRSRWQLRDSRSVHLLVHFIGKNL
jgi:hypothetical protein